MSIRDKYCPPHINRLEPYIPGFQPAAEDKILKINSNENAYPPSPRVVEALRASLDERLRLYPNATAAPLRSKIASLYNIDERFVFAGSGADEIITILFRTFTEPGDRVVLSYPTYTYYASTAQIHNVDYDYFDTEDDFRINLNNYIQPGTKIAFLANPNAHTGLVIPPAEIERLVQNYPGLVVVDETYIDFAPPGNSVYRLVPEYENLIVLRTFSKSFSLCGIRVGYGFMHPDLVEAMDMTKDSYNISFLSQVAAVAALEDFGYMQENARRICETREWFTAELQKLGFEVIPSAGNFVFARHPRQSAESIYNGLLERGILVRYFDSRRMNEHLRISMGTREQMAGVLEAIAALLGA